MQEVREAKKDCFGWNKEMNRCIALKETYCKKEHCNFYKKKGTLCNNCPSKRTGECTKCKTARADMI